jgi:hypothetical protein
MGMNFHGKIEQTSMETSTTSQHDKPVQKLIFASAGRPEFYGFCFVTWNRSGRSECNVM